jgi:cellulose synthase/poly-beta-1,6-N-acetylglucosamine synthase-like glycosyltransferase
MYHIINIISLTTIILTVVVFFILSFLNHYNTTSKLTKIASLPKISILIPARDESSVIESLLLSIKESSYKINMHDVYIIVESFLDPTITLAKKYHCQYFVRTDFKLHTKAGALNELLVSLATKNIYYDLYYIMDADNIIAKDFIKNSLSSYYAGYDIMIGYRANKNGNDNVISAASGLTFSMINELMNTTKVKDHKNVIISGTGYFIKGSLIKKFKGFPFFSLTEDYELTLYSELYNLSTAYNPKAIFYDEQPTDLNTTIMERTRWIKGFLVARKLYLKKIIASLKTTSLNRSSKIDEIVNIKLVIIIVFNLLLYLLNNIIYLFFNFNLYSLFNIIFIILLIYLGLVLFTYVVMRCDKDLALTPKMKLKVLFYNPIYLAMYLPCFFKALFTRNITWTKITHSKTKITML